MENGEHLAIAVHGGGGGAWEWDVWKSEFESLGFCFHPINLEPEGGGYEETTVDDYVNQIVAFSLQAASRKLGSDTRIDVLIGASMGGVLSIKACELINPRALILVCSCIPSVVPGQADLDNETIVCPKKEFPPVVRWASGNFSDTVSSLPGRSKQRLVDPVAVASFSRLTPMNARQMQTRRPTGRYPFPQMSLRGSSRARWTTACLCAQKSAQPVHARMHCARMDDSISAQERAKPFHAGMDDRNG